MNLVNSSRNYPSDNHQEHLFEQYKLYVASAEESSRRRDNANAFFWTVQSAALAIFGVAVDQKNIALSFLFPLFMLPVTILWSRIIHSYRQLNTGKFTVLHELESKLPVNLYKYEWEVLGKGEDDSKYRPTSHIEELLPKLILTFWVIAFSYVLFFMIGNAKVDFSGSINFDTKSQSGEL